MAIHPKLAVLALAGARVSMRNGAMAVYQLSQGGRSLTGQYFRNRYRTGGTFEKRELP